MYTFRTRWELAGGSTKNRGCNVREKKKTVIVVKYDECARGSRRLYVTMLAAIARRRRKTTDEKKKSYTMWWNCIPTIQNTVYTSPADPISYTDFSSLHRCVRENACRQRRKKTRTWNLSLHWYQFRYFFFPPRCLLACKRAFLCRGTRWQIREQQSFSFVLIGNREIKNIILCCEVAQNRAFAAVFSNVRKTQKIEHTTRYVFLSHPLPHPPEPKSFPLRRYYAHSLREELAGTRHAKENTRTV